MTETTAVHERPMGETAQESEARRKRERKELLLRNRAVTPVTIFVSNEATGIAVLTDSDALPCSVTTVVLNALGALGHDADGLDWGWATDLGLCPTDDVTVEAIANRLRSAGFTEVTIERIAA